MSWYRSRSKPDSPSVFKARRGQKRNDKYHYSDICTNPQIPFYSEPCAFNTLYLIIGDKGFVFGTYFELPGSVRICKSMRIQANALIKYVWLLSDVTVMCCL